MRFRIPAILGLLLLAGASLGACSYDTRTASAYYYSDYDYYTSRAYLRPDG